MREELGLVAMAAMSAPEGRQFAATIAGAVGLLLVVAILTLGVDGPDHDMVSRVLGAVAVVVVTVAVVVCILFLEIVRVIVGSVLGGGALLLTLAIWQVGREVRAGWWISQRWGVWLGSTIGLLLIFVLLMLVPFEPVPWQHWLWMAAPVVVPAAIGSTVGGVYQHYRRRAAARAAASRLEMLASLGALLRSKLERDKAADAAERGRVERIKQEREAADAVDRARAERVKQEREWEQARLSALRTQNAEWRVRALAVGEGQWRGLPVSRDEGFTLKIDVLRALYDATAGRHDRGVLLSFLAEECGMALELTYFLVSGFVYQGYAWEVASPEREDSSHIGVGIALQGIYRLEDFVGKKPGISHSIVVGSVGAGAQLSNVGRDQKGEILNRSSALDAALPEVLRVARGVHDRIEDPAQKGFIEEQLRVVEDGPVEEKRSALRALKAFSHGLGEVAKPMLDTLNGISDLFT